MARTIERYAGKLHDVRSVMRNGQARFTLQPRTGTSDRERGGDVAAPRRLAIMPEDGRERRAGNFSHPTIGGWASGLPPTVLQQFTWAARRWALCVGRCDAQTELDRAGMAQVVRPSPRVGGELAADALLGCAVVVP
jgi:hypothetical protein